MSSRVPYDDQFLDRLSDALARRGWRLPALFALEAGRPMALVGGQLIWLGQPFLNLFFSADDVGRAARLLEEPEAVNALISRLRAQE